MAKSRSYVSDLIESLKDPVEAAEYLNAALEDSEPEVFLLALRDVVESFGGMGKLSVATALNRENLYRMLSNRGNPEFFSLLTILNATGFRLGVMPKTLAAKTIILHAFGNQNKASMPKYSLAADTDSELKSEVLLRTDDDVQVGVLDFDYQQSMLFIRLTKEMPIGEVMEAEIRTNDGKVLTAQISPPESGRLILLRKKKVFPKDVSQITLMAK